MTAETQYNGEEVVYYHYLRIGIIENSTISFLSRDYRIDDDVVDFDATNVRSCVQACDLLIEL